MTAQAEADERLQPSSRLLVATKLSEVWDRLFRFRWRLIGAQEGLVKVG